MFGASWMDVAALQGFQPSPLFVLLALAIIVFVVVIGSRFAGLVGQAGKPCARCGKLFDPWTYIKKDDEDNWYHPVCYMREIRARPKGQGNG